MRMRIGRSSKLLAVIMAAVLCLGLSLTGCTGGSGASSGGGASGEKQADPLVGKYIPVVGQMMGVALTGEDLSGFAIELQSGGKAVLTVDGEDHKVKWTSDDSTVTVTVDKDNQIVGNLGKDYFEVKDMLGMGMDFTFAKEGTPAADPAQYLPETEKFMLQDWQSVSVTDILGDPTDEIAPDALKITFRGDHTADVSVEGEALGSFSWGNVGDWGQLSGDDVPDVSWKVLEDGLSVDYVKDGTYYTFFCPKDPKNAKAAETKAEETKAETKAEETKAETEAETKAPEETKAAAGAAAAGAAAAGARSAAQAALGAHGTAASSPYADYWDRDWYGWYQLESCSGEYEKLEGYCYDVCGSIFVESNDGGRIILWDEDGSAELALCAVDVSFGPGTTDAGCMKSESGSFLSDEQNVGHADWIVDPGASDVSSFDHMIEIDGSYEDDKGSLRYYIFMRPWGMEWEDIREVDSDLLPTSYDYWYTDVMDGPMPDSIGVERDGGSFGSSQSERFESYTVLDTPVFYPAGTLTVNDCYLLPNQSLDNGADGYILDNDTILEKPEELDGWEAGDDPMSWMERLCYEGNTYTPAGVYDITVTGDHIDIVHGLYWWD